MLAFRASRMPWTWFSSTKSNRFFGSSPAGLKQASTVVLLSMSMVASSFPFATSRVLMMFLNSFLPASYVLIMLRRTLLSSLLCSVIPLVRNAVWARRMTDSS